MKVYILETDLYGLYMYRVFIQNYSKPIDTFYTKRSLTYKQQDEISELYEEALAWYRPLMLKDYDDNN